MIFHKDMGVVFKIEKKRGHLALKSSIYFVFDQEYRGHMGIFWKIKEKICLHSSLIGSLK